MSSTLTWEPAYRKTNSLSYELKLVLQKYLGGTVDSDMDISDLKYLEGLRDAGVIDAQILIDAIEKHDRIHVKEQF